MSSLLPILPNTQALPVLTPAPVSTATPASSSPSNSQAVQQNVAHVKPMQQQAATSGSAVTSSTDKAGTKMAQFYQSVNVNVNGVVKSVLIPVTTGSKQIKSVTTISKAGEASTPRLTAPQPRLVRAQGGASSLLQGVGLKGGPRVMVMGPVRAPAPKPPTVVTPGTKVFMGSDGKMYMQVDQKPSPVTKVAMSPQSLLLPSGAKLFTPNTPTTAATPAGTLRMSMSTGNTGTKTVSYVMAGTTEAMPSLKLSSVVPSTAATSPRVLAPLPIPASATLKIDSVYSLSSAPRQQQQQQQQQPAPDTPRQHKVIEIAPVDDGVASAAPPQVPTPASTPASTPTPTPASDVSEEGKEGAEGTQGAEGGDRFRVLAEWEPEVTSRDSEGILQEADDIVMSFSQQMSQKTVTRSPTSSSLASKPSHSMVVSGSACRPRPATMQVSYSAATLGGGVRRVVIAPSTSASVSTPSPPALHPRPALMSALKRPLPGKSPVPAETTSKQPRLTTETVVTSSSGSPASVLKTTPRTSSTATSPRKPTEPTIMNYCHVVLEKLRLRGKRSWRTEELPRLWKMCPKCPLAVRNRRLACRKYGLAALKKPRLLPAPGPSSSSSSPPAAPSKPRPAQITAVGAGTGKLLSQADLKGKFLLIKTSAGSYLVPMQQGAEGAAAAIPGNKSVTPVTVAPKLLKPPGAGSPSKPQPQPQPQPAADSPPVKVKEEPRSEGYPGEQPLPFITITPTRNASTPSNPPTAGTSLLKKSLELPSHHTTTSPKAAAAAAASSPPATEQSAAREKEDEEKEEVLTPAERIRRLRDKLRQDQEELNRVNRERMETQRLLRELDDD